MFDAVHHTNVTCFSIEWLILHVACFLNPNMMQQPDWSSLEVIGQVPCTKLSFDLDYPFLRFPQVLFAKSIYTLVSGQYSV